MQGLAGRGHQVHCQVRHQSQLGAGALQLPEGQATLCTVQSPGLTSLLVQDGTELCRIVGILTQGKVPEEMVYRTQNIRQTFKMKIPLGAYYNNI